jgi:hypothetical protein
MIADLVMHSRGGMDELDTVVVGGNASAAVADEASKPKPRVHSSRWALFSDAL